MFSHECLTIFFEPIQHESYPNSKDHLKTDTGADNCEGDVDTKLLKLNTFKISLIS